MHIESVPNRKSHPTILLRESYRADGKVKKRTIANLTNWPEPLVEGLRTLRRGGVPLATADEALTISRSLPHGHVAAVLGTAEQIGLPKLLSERRGGLPIPSLIDCAPYSPSDRPTPPTPPAVSASRHHGWSPVNLSFSLHGPCDT